MSKKTNKPIYQSVCKTSMVNFLLSFPLLLSQSSCIWSEYSFGHCAHTPGLPPSGHPEARSVANGNPPEGDAVWRSCVPEEDSVVRSEPLVWTSKRSDRGRRRRRRSAYLQDLYTYLVSAFQAHSSSFSPNFSKSVCVLRL